MKEYDFPIELFDVVDDYGEIEAFAWCVHGSVATITFKETIDLHQKRNDNELYLNTNSCSGSLQPFGFFTPNPFYPLTVNIRPVDKAFLVSNDRKTFVFCFMLFFGEDEPEKEFYQKSEDERGDIIKTQLVKFFTLLTSSGAFYREENFYTKQPTASITNKMISSLVKFWGGIFIKKMED